MKRAYIIVEAKDSEFDVLRAGVGGTYIWVARIAVHLMAELEVVRGALLQGERDALIDFGLGRLVVMAVKHGKVEVEL